MQQNFGFHNRDDSYHESRGKFAQQEIAVLNAIQKGCTHSWAIAKKTHFLITSVRRACHDLCIKGRLKQTGSVFYEPTNRSVTKFKLVKRKKKK